MSDAETPDLASVRVADLVRDASLVRGAHSLSSPRASVVVHAGTGPVEGLEETLGDLLAQAVDDLEVVVVDDGGDEVPRWLERRRRDDDRVVWLRHASTIGLPAVRFNEGYEVSRGRWVAFLSAGARWKPTALGSLLAAGESAGAPCLVVAATLGGVSGSATTARMPLPINVLSLTLRNVAGRTGVLVERSLLEWHGIFDSHLALARQFDWDLWLRLAQRAPLVLSEAQVGREPPGVQVDPDPSQLEPADRAGFRVFAAIPRDHELIGRRWREACPFAASVAGFSLPAAFRRDLESAASVWLSRHGTGARGHHAARGGQSLAPCESGPQGTTLLLAGDSYYPALELCFPAHRAEAADGRTLLSCYEPAVQITRESLEWADGLVLVRTVTEPGHRLLEMARASGRPVAYYLDDDLLNLHLLGPPWDCMAPGTERDREVRRQLAGADAVWSTSARITAVAKSLNPRVVPHQGAIEERYLPSALRPRASGGALRIGAIGSGYQSAEFSLLWPALEEFSRRYGPRIEFEFWGIDVTALPRLQSPLSRRPYRLGYRAFLAELAAAEFDVLLCPLLGEPAPRLAKAPSKYFHAAVAGALGIFSDVVPFEVLPGGLTCLKVGNTPAAWLAAMVEACEMAEERFDGLRAAMLEHVRREYSVSAQADLHLAAWEATAWHAGTRTRRGADGRPSVLFCCPGEEQADEEVLNAAVIAEEYGIRPLVVGSAERGLPSRCLRFGVPLWHREGEEGVTVEVLLEAETISLVHATREVEGLGAACRRHGVPMLVGPGVTMGTTRSPRLHARAAEGLMRRYAATISRPEAPSDSEPLSGEAAPGAPLSERAEPGQTRVSGPAGTLVRPFQDRLRHGLHRAGLFGSLMRARWAIRKKRVLVVFDADVVSVDLYFRSVSQDLERATGREWVLRPSSEVGPYDFHTASTVVFPRALSSRCVDLLAAARRAGCLTIYDADDNLLLVEQLTNDPNNPWRRVFGAASADIEALIRGVHLVKVYSPAAVPIFERLNPRVIAVRPPRPPVEQEPKLAAPAGSARVGFFGSAYKDDEFPPVAAAIGSLTRSASGPSFEALGFLPQMFAEVPKVRWFPWRSSYREYRRFLASRQWSVGLAPLRDLDFNRCKAAAKYLEYSSLGIAGIYSDVPTYRAAVAHEVNGLLVDHERPSAWQEAIERLLGDPELRGGIVARAREDLLANYSPERYAREVAELIRRG